MKLLKYIIALLLLLVLAQVAQCYGIGPRYSGFYADWPDYCDEQQKTSEGDGTVSCYPGSATIKKPPQDGASCSSSNSCKDSGQGLGLRLGANTAAAIAQNAAKMAKAANEAQAGAAAKAAKLVRIQLAEKAMQAARAANAVLEGKEAVVKNFERELHDAEDRVIQASASLDKSESNAEGASAASTYAEALKDRLKGILKQTMAGLADIDAFEKQVNADLEEKTEMLLKAEELVERLEQQLAWARDDYEKMKKVARHASKAAAQARQEINAAASTCGSKGKREILKHSDALLAAYVQLHRDREARKLQQKQYLQKH
ncbi:tropomyosin [Drosophila subobscura]|uniref:tropomyosin n=1 Tax=Drosophila subobscura TaxID=7241 RepID=UPI00155A6CC1|nr:tropomyosin [Drosophila subobscura]